MRNTGSLEGDRRLWEYLPVVFAVFLTMVANNEASAYNMQTEGTPAVLQPALSPSLSADGGGGVVTLCVLAVTSVYETNIGVLAKTFIRLANAALPPVNVSAGPKTSDNPAVAEAHRKFVQVRSLRRRAGPVLGGRARA